MKIVDKYEVNNYTSIILPSFHTDYYSIILERFKSGYNVIYARQTGKEIIENGCMRGGSNLKGRQNSVTSLTGIKRTIPVPVNPNRGIYAFPTGCPDNYDCIWIFQAHIKEVVKNPKNPKCTDIILKKDKIVTIDVPLRTIKKQMHGTAYCILVFSDWSGNDDDEGTEEGGTEGQVETTEKQLLKYVK